MPSPVLLSERQLADRIGLARATLAKLRCAGGGPPFIKLGSRVFYREDDVGEWLDAQPRRRSTSDVSVDQVRSADA